MMTAWIDDVAEGLRLDQWMAEVVVDCPGCPHGEVRWQGRVSVVRGQDRARLLGVPCIACGREYLLEFDLVPGSKLEH